MNAGEFSVIVIFGVFVSSILSLIYIFYLGKKKGLSEEKHFEIVINLHNLDQLEALARDGNCDLVGLHNTALTLLMEISKRTKEGFDLVLERKSDGRHISLTCPLLEEVKKLREENSDNKE